MHQRDSTSPKGYCSNTIIILVHLVFMRSSLNQAGVPQVPELGLICSAFSKSSGRYPVESQQIYLTLDLLLKIIQREILLGFSHYSGGCCSEKATNFKSN